MHSAGRILIIPRGIYNETETYHLLDLVSYNGATWLAKQTVTGVLPSDENHDYWHNMLGISLGEMDTKLHDMAEQIMTIESVAQESNNIAKGRNRAHVFGTTDDMKNWLADEANKGLCAVGDNLYIVDVGVPDWWVSDVLDSVDAETGWYYQIAQLETQKVDLTDVEKRLGNALYIVSFDADTGTLITKSADYTGDGKK